MSRFPAESLRIESASLETGTDELKYLPLYCASDKSGELPVNLQGNALKIFLNSSNGRQVHTIRLRRYPPRLRRTPCIQCPECEEWRKRLFLETDVGTGSTSFHCRECMKDALL